MDEVRRLAESNLYTIHSECTEDAAGSTRHHFTCKTEGCEHRKVITIDKASEYCFVEENGPHNHPLASLEQASRLPHSAGAHEDGDGALPDVAHPPTFAEHATRVRRLASKNVSKVVQMFKSSSQHTSDEDRSPRQMQQRGGEANLPLGSPACEAITPRSRMNPPTPSTASPPPAGGSGHTASTAVAADRLLGEEPISSTDINASAMATAAPDVVDERHPARYPGYEGVNTSDSRVRVTEYFEGGVVEGKPNEGKPRLALLFDGPEHEYQDEYNWRKYGKKPIKGYANPRFYWRCTYDSCGVQRHTQLLVTGETEVLYDGCHCHLPPPAKAARGRGRGRIASEVPVAAGRALETALTRDIACVRAASSGATTGGNSCGAATRAASSGLATGPPVPAADDAAGPPSTDAAVLARRGAEEGHAHGEAATKRKALFMRTARMKAPTAAAMMGSPTEEDFDEPMPVKRSRPAAAAAAVELFPEPAASPRAAAADAPRVVAGLSPRSTPRRGAATVHTRSPMRAVSLQNAAAGRQSLPVDAQNLSRCPLYFLACVAAKEKFTSV